MKTTDKSDNEETEYNHWFLPFKKGSKTDKGIIDELFFLQFDGFAGGNKVKEPKGKGLLMAGIGNKMYVIGDLKLLTHNP